MAFIVCFCNFTFCMVTVWILKGSSFLPRNRVKLSLNYKLWLSLRHVGFGKPAGTKDSPFWQALLILVRKEEGCYYTMGTGRDVYGTQVITHLGTFSVFPCPTVIVDGQGQ